MILNVSGRTDIIAFYTKWFLNRLNEGFVDVRNPFNPNLVSRINFTDVDLILFCTKNPIPIINDLDKIKIPFLFHITITPYKSDIEPLVPSKTKVIEAVKIISQKIGKENISIRYDPIFISNKYTVDYHIKAFEKLLSLLNGYTNKIIVSFLDEYKNVIKNKNIIKYKTLTEEDYKKIGTNFSNIAKKYNMTVQTCFEDRNLTEYGFIKEDCLSHELAYYLTGKKYKSWKSRKGGKCNCVEMVDIGAYNTCKHFCKYCYANYDENKVNNNTLNHNSNSSLITGTITDKDTIKVRKI